MTGLFQGAARLGSRVVSFLPLLPLLSLLPLLAASPARADGKPVQSAEAQVWLQRIHEAAQGANYHGTLVVSGEGRLSSARVWHYAVGDQVYERLESLDGDQQHIVRHNDAVHTLWPANRVAVVEKRETLAAWSTAPQSVHPQALAHYELRREGMSRVAGREAAVLLLQPRDGLRYAQRLWADKSSGLMLRADVLADPANGAVLESAAFSEVQIGVKPQPEQVLQATRRLEGYRMVKPVQRRTTLEAEGWTLARPVPGFTLGGCLERGMPSSGDDSPVLQAVFTDGLAHVSLFVEPYRPAVHRDASQARRGATSTISQRRGDHWVTVVGDVPSETLTRFAQALERQRR